MRARNGCDTTSYTYAKGKINALKHLAQWGFAICLVCPFHILREENEKSQSESPASNVSQSVLALSARPSEVHAVESGRLASPTR